MFVRNEASQAWLTEPGPPVELCCRGALPPPPRSPHDRAAGVLKSHQLCLSAETFMRLGPIDIPLQEQEGRPVLT